MNNPERAKIIRISRVSKKQKLDREKIIYAKRGLSLYKQIELEVELAIQKELEEQNKK